MKTFVAQYWGGIVTTGAMLTYILNYRKFRSFELKLNGVLTILLEKQKQAGVEEGRQLQREEFNTARAPRSPKIK